MEKARETFSEFDEKSIPKEFIYPQRAEQGNCFELNAIGISIQVSFKRENDRFRISGISKEESGVIISGRIGEDVAKINHFEVAKDLREIGIGKTLLLKLEKELIEQGVNTIYCKFSHDDIISFLLKNGYEIISHKYLTEELKRRLLINPLDLDNRINKKEEYDNLSSVELKTHKQILLIKKLTK